jgi:hypothetical protein
VPTAVGIDDADWAAIRGAVCLRFKGERPRDICSDVVRNRPGQPSLPATSAALTAASLEHRRSLHLVGTESAA